MDIAFTDLKEKEIINVTDGKKLGRIIDFLFDIETGQIKGIIVPGERKIFKRNEDIFVPLEKIRRIGGDVILVKLKVQNSDAVFGSKKVENTFQSRYNLKNYYGENYDEYNNYNKTLVGGKFAGSHSQNNRPQNYPIQNCRTENCYNDKSVVSAPKINVSQRQNSGDSFVRFKPINNIKYK